MRDRQRGSALIWALVLLMFAASLSALMLERGRAVDGASKTDLAALKERYAIEGGLAVARHRLAADAGYAGETVRVGECQVTLEVEQRDAGWVVRVRAAPGGAPIEALLRRCEGLPAIESRSDAAR